MAKVRQDVRKHFDQIYAIGYNLGWESLPEETTSTRAWNRWREYKKYQRTNPLRQFCCRVCGECAPKRLLPHSKFPERMSWLRHHYMMKHPELWPWRNPLLETIGTGIATGAGLGAGLVLGKTALEKVLKNPASLLTESQIATLNQLKQGCGRYRISCNTYTGLAVFRGDGKKAIVDRRGRILKG